MPTEKILEYDSAHLSAAKSISNASRSDMSGLNPHSPIARRITGTRAALPLPALQEVASRCWHTRGFAEIWCRN